MYMLCLGSPDSLPPSFPFVNNLEIPDQKIQIMPMHNVQIVQYLLLSTEQAGTYLQTSFKCDII